MDIDLGDILHSQGLVTQIWMSSCLAIKQITPTFLGKIFQIVKNPVGQFNKKLELNFVCPQTVISCKYLFNLISTVKNSPLTFSLSSNHPTWSFACRGNLSGQVQTIDGRVSVEGNICQRKGAGGEETLQDCKRLP